MKIECTVKELKELVKDDVSANKEINIAMGTNLEQLIKELKPDVVQSLKNVKFIDEFFKN